MLVWLPLLIPAVDSLRYIGSGPYTFDFLMPAGFLPVALAGGVQLAWASVRARSRRKTILWGLGAGIGLFFVGQAVAVSNGLASGATEPNFESLSPIIGAIGAYMIGLIVAGIGGVLLIRDLFAPSATAA